MNTRLAVAAVAAAFVTSAAAQMGPGMNPGSAGAAMMHGQHMGSGTKGDHEDCAKHMGMEGDHHGGVGMMGGQGGMMGGGHGMGAGMMHGRGGMMGGGHGMGAGMMGGGHEMGAGMMDGLRGLERLGLSDDQRAKVREIRRDLQRKHHALMGSLHDVRWQAEDNERGGAFDETAARKNYDAMAAIRKQEFESRLEAHKRIEAVLTKEQREQLRSVARHGGPRAR